MRPAPSSWLMPKRRRALSSRSGPDGTRRWCERYPPPARSPSHWSLDGRTLLIRLVDWAKAMGPPWSGRQEPTPGHVRRVARRRDAGGCPHLGSAGWKPRLLAPEPPDEQRERELAQAEPPALKPSERPESSRRRTRALTAQRTASYSPPGVRHQQQPWISSSTSCSESQQLAAFYFFVLRKKEARSRKSSKLKREQGGAAARRTSASRPRRKPGQRPSLRQAAQPAEENETALAEPGDPDRGGARRGAGAAVTDSHA